MALPDAEGPTWKLQRAIANTYAPLRGVLLILNVLLYHICPVSAIAAPARHPSGSLPYYNSPTAGHPKWHTDSFADSCLANSTFANSTLANSTLANSTIANSTIANCSLSTWGSTFASGSGLLTFFSVHTAQGHPSSSGFHRLPFANHSPRNISTLPLFANMTHRRDGTTPMTPSPSRYLRPGNHEATTTRHYTNLTSWTSPILSSSTLVHRKDNSSDHSASNAFLLASLTGNTTRPYHDIATANLSLAKTGSISFGMSSMLPSSSTGLPSFTPSAHYSSLRGNMTRAHGNITTAGASPAKSSSLLSGVSSTPSSYPHSDITTADLSFANNGSMSSGVSSTPSLPLSSRSQSFASPLDTSSSTQVSRPSSLPTKARYGSPPASSSTNPSRSSSASITPKPSTTSTTSVASDSSSLANNRTLSLPPGCKISTWDGQTFILIPTERARLAHPHPTYISGSSSATTSQAGATGYHHPGGVAPAPGLDKAAIDKSPSSKTAGLALGCVMGLFPLVISLPIAMYDFWRWRAERDEKEGRIRRIPPNPALDMLDIYDDIKDLKWNERVAVWLQDFRAWSRIMPDNDFPTISDERKKKNIKRDALIRKLLRIRAYQGPTFKNEIRRLKNTRPDIYTKSDPGSCNYNTRAEMRGCLPPPDDWPKPDEEGSRLTHEEAMALSEQLPEPVKSAKMKYGKILKVLKVPEGYERLALDSKMAYLKYWTKKISIADPRLRFYDGRCAAVGPGNSPLGGQDVDKLWLDDDLNLTLDDTKVEPGTEVGEMWEMVQTYEKARFVRHNFPIDRFEGGSVGSQFDQNPPIPPEQGKGKGRAKVTTFEELTKDLTFPQAQAMDMQMDHDLLGISDYEIIDWWNTKYMYPYTGPEVVHQPPIEEMRTMFWSQQFGLGPGVGDYTEWGNRLPETPPEEVEIRIRNPANTPNRGPLNSPVTPYGTPDEYFPSTPESEYPHYDGDPPPPPPPSVNQEPVDPAEEAARQAEEEAWQAEWERGKMTEEQIADQAAEQAAEQARQAEEQAADQAAEQARQAEEQIADQAAEQARQAEEHAAEQARQAAEQARQAEEQANRQAEEQARQDEENARQDEEKARRGKEELEKAKEQLRKLDQELKDEAKARRAHDRRLRREQAKQRVREQMRQADEARHLEAEVRREEARILENAKKIEKIQDEIREEDRIARAKQRKADLSKQRINDWKKQMEAVRQRQALVDADQGFKPPKKPKPPKNDPKQPKNDPAKPEDANPKPKQPKNDPKQPKTDPKQPKTDPAKPKDAQPKPKQPKNDPKQPKTDPKQPKNDPKKPYKPSPKSKPTKPKNDGGKPNRRPGHGREDPEMGNGGT